MEYKDGFLTLPGGMKYRILVLPDSLTMTPRIAQKIKKLVDSGALMIGPKPGKSPSLTGYPHCDAEIQSMADQLWDNGKVFLEQMLRKFWRNEASIPISNAISPWCDGYTGIRKHGPLFRRQRSSQRPISQCWLAMVANCSFRVTGAKPEIWDPETGLISPVGMYDISDGMTRIPLDSGGERVGFCCISSRRITFTCTKYSKHQPQRQNSPSCWWPASSSADCDSFCRLWESG